MKTLFCVLMLVASPVFAAVKVPDTATLAQSVDQAIALAEKSPYSELTLSTTNGSFSGQVIQKTDHVVVMRIDTGRTLVKTQQKRIDYHFIAVDSIKAVSFTVAE